MLSFQEPGAVTREGDNEAELRDERLDWFLLQRTYPTPFFNLPPSARSDTLALAMLREGLEWGALKRVLKPRPFWRPIGSPTIQSFGSNMRPTTGRVSAVAISPADPNVILIGAATGGIWRSEDGGKKFVPVTDNQTELAIGSIAFSNSNPLVVYAGLGDRIGGYMGTGVLKSTDSGKSWAKVGVDSLPPSVVTKVLVSPVSHERVYIAEYRFRDPTDSGNVRDGGFRFSDNGGATWSGAVIRGLPRDLAHHPTAPDTLYLSLVNHLDPPGPPAAVFKSRDGGRSWATILVPDEVRLPELKFDFKLGVTPAAPEILYVAATRINPDGGRRVDLIVSEDGGETWKPPVPITRRDIADKVVEFLAVDPRDARTIYLGSEDLFKSTDGGASWSNLSHNYRLGNDGAPIPQFFAGLTHIDQRDFAFSREDRKVIYVVNDGGVWRSNNCGLSDGRRAFHHLHENLPVAQLLSITAHAQRDDTIYAGTQDNGALILTGADGLWREFVTGDSGGVILDDEDADLSYVNFHQGNINRYKNADVFTQTHLSNNAEFGETDNRRPRVGFFPPFAMSPLTGAFYFGTWRLFKSPDGDNWTEASPEEDILTKGVSADFRDFRPDVLSAVGVSRSREGVIYTGSAHGKVMMTEDDGRSWKDITGALPNRFVKSIVVKHDDPRTVYLTFSGFGTGHVFKSTDGGASWTDIGGCPPSWPHADWCLPDVPANALLLDPKDEATIYVGTDVGVFRTTTGGTLWSRFNEGLPPVVVTDFAVTRDGRILLATYGRGAFELVR